MLLREGQAGEISNTGEMGAPRGPPQKSCSSGLGRVWDFEEAHARCEILNLCFSAITFMYILSPI
jgi:hypothetical protein